MEFFLKYKKLLVLFILFITGFVIYSNSLNNEFFWDDDDSIVNNVFIKDWQYLHNYFTQNLIAGSGQVTNYWRPVLLISFASDYQLGGLDPFIFHLTNILLHCLVAWLVFFLLYKLTNKKFILPFLVSLFFLIHPLQTEAVTYVAGRADPLSAVFSLLAIIFYIDYRSSDETFPVWRWPRTLAAYLLTWRRWQKRKNINPQQKCDKFNVRGKSWKYFLSLFFLILGLLTKEQVVLLPVLILLVELTFLTKRFSRRDIFKIIKFILPFVLLSGIYLALRLTILNFNNLLHSFTYQPDYDAKVIIRLLTFCKVIVEYFKLLFAPFGLHMAREVGAVTSLGDWHFLVFVCLSIIVALTCFLTWRKDRKITFGFLWFFIILLPRTNFWQINRPMYEHWLYLPMVGFWLAFFSLLVLWFNKIKEKSVRLAFFLVYFSFFVLLTYFIGFSVLTIKRNNDWQNAITFYEKNLQHTPNSFIQHNNLGMAYAEAGEEQKAVEEYKKAIIISDNYAQVHHNLGNSLKSLGRIDEATEEYKKAIIMSPSFILPYNNLLDIYLARNQTEEINSIFKKMQVIFGNDKEFLYSEGAVYYDLGEFDKAIQTWRKLLTIEKDISGVVELIEKAKIMKREKESVAQ